MGDGDGWNEGKGEGWREGEGEGVGEGAVSSRAAAGSRTSTPNPPSVLCSQCYTICNSFHLPLPLPLPYPRSLSHPFSLPFFFLNLFLFYPFPHSISRPFSRPFTLPLSLLHTEGEGVLVPLTSNPPFSPALSPSPSLSHALSLLSVLLLDELQSLAVAWRQQVTLYRFKPVSVKPCINFYTENYHLNVLFFMNVFSFFCRLFVRISSRGTHHTADMRVLERNISYRSTLSCAYQWSSVWCCWRR